MSQPPTPQPGIRKRLFWSFSAQTVSTLVRIAIQLLVVPVLIGYWGTSLYADWIIVQSAAAFLSIADLCLQIYYGNSLLITWSRGDIAGYRRSLAIALGCYVVIVGTTSILLTASTLFIPWPSYLGAHTMSPGSTLLLGTLLALAALITIPIGVVTNIYRARGHYGRGVSWATAFETARGVGACAIAALGGSPLHAGMLYLGIAVLYWAAILVDQWQLYGEVPLAVATPTRQEIREAVSNIILYITPVIGTPLLLNGPVLLLGAIGKQPEAVVAFTVCRTLAGLVRQVMQQGATAIGIEITRELSLSNLAAVRRLLMAGGRLTSAISGLLGGSVLLVAAPFIRIWTHGHVTPVPHLMTAFIATLILLAPAQVGYQTFLTSNRPRVLAISSILQILLTLSLCVALIGPLSAVGAALAVGVAEFLSVGLMVPIAACRELDQPEGAYFRNCLAVAFSSFLISAALSWFILEHLRVENLFHVVIFGTAWAVLSALPAFFLLFSKEDRIWTLSRSQALLRRLGQ